MAKSKKLSESHWQYASFNLSVGSADRSSQYYQFTQQNKVNTYSLQKKRDKTELNCQEKPPLIFLLIIPKAVKLNKVTHGQIKTCQYVIKSKTRCIKRIRVSKHQKCDGLSTVQTVQLKQLLFICGKLQIGNGFLQCYQISHNTRIRWGFFFFFLASFFSDKY